MELSTLDWIVLAMFLLVTLGIGLAFGRRAGQGTGEFFLAGRKLPWWLAGTSMVATTFAADTPLLVTELVARNGISGNWLWWNALIGGMLTTFFFARLWRRANILTDVELIELRYSGMAAVWLRGFKAVYLGVFLNSVIIAWVNVALMSIFQVFFGMSAAESLWWVAAAMLVVAVYSAISGFLGVAMTDFFQFGLAMTGCVVLAWKTIDAPQIGGIAGLKAQLPEAALAFFPRIGEGGDGSGLEVYSIGLATFLAFVGFQWWASWYPGAEPGGGGYVAQRMMSAKDESHALRATLFFQIAHYCLRPWPWILVGLCAVVLYPHLSADEQRLGYLYAIRDFLPAGWRGLLLAAFLAAYMSTISTQLNWGAGYLINDLYQRFWPEHARDRSVWMARIATFVIMLVALAVTSQIKTLESAFHFVISCGAGLGAVLILRWYWWRINAWSEWTATLAPFVGMGLSVYAQWSFPYDFYLTVGLTTAAWLLVTWLTPPTEAAVLDRFYARVLPAGAWQPVQARTNAAPSEAMGTLLWRWMAGILTGYACLFGIGKLLLGEWMSGLGFMAVALVGAVWLFGKKW